MQKERLVLGLAGVFAGTTVLVVLVSIAFAQPALFVVAVPMAVATYVFWYQASGKLKRRVKRTQARSRSRGVGGRADPGRGGFGAGPRPPPPGARGQAAWEAWERRQREWRQQRRQRQNAAVPSTGLSAAEAYRRLGLEPDADEQRVKRAYRERVKDVHPDRGGSEEEFKKVTEAYETLT